MYAYCGNTTIDLDPLPVRHARLAVVETALFERDVFEMAAPIQSPVKFEMLSVIRFLNAKGERPAEILWNSRTIITTHLLRQLPKSTERGPPFFSFEMCII